MYQYNTSEQCVFSVATIVCENLEQCCVVQGVKHSIFVVSIVHATKKSFVLLISFSNNHDGYYWKETI